MNSMMALVSCPQYDWRCSTCDKCVNEVDKSRRWVDPRPCPKCKKPMETWRTRESICPIFKPEGSAPSPRELKVHGVPLPRATGVPLKRCEQPNCLRWANNGFDSCCAACTNPSLEQPAHTVQCGQRQDALQARVMREASLPDLDPPPETQPVNHLLFDRSPAGAIACRCEVGDRLHRQAMEDREQRVQELKIDPTLQPVSSAS